jgi:8-oxo-dGTP pyrophosphatase MutT (NUDIX family)
VSFVNVVEENGKQIVEHPGSVAIVAVDRERRLWLVRQFRQPARRELLEIPAGVREEGEDPLTTAKRELEEECGLVGFAIGPLLWEEEGFSLEEPGHGGWAHRVYLVRVAAFENAPMLDLRDEGSHEERWFTVDELDGVPTRPTDLADRLRRLL